MSVKNNSNIIKNRALGAFLAAGLAVVLGTTPSRATQDWQAGIQLRPGSAAVAAAPKAGGKVATALLGGRQSTLSGWLSNLREAGQDLNMAARQGISRTRPTESAQAASTACNRIIGAFTGRVGAVGEIRCDRTRP
ncbi:MAG: hypothetical protein ACR2QB_00770 [Gammaproteobacteria bacterium]